MSLLHSQVDTKSEVFRRNREVYDRQRAEIAAAREVAVAGGGAQARDRYKSRGKLPARERITTLLDPGTALLLRLRPPPRRASPGRRLHAPRKPHPGAVASARSTGVTSIPRRRSDAKRLSIATPR